MKFKTKQSETNFCNFARGLSGVKINKVVVQQTKSRTLFEDGTAINR